MRLFATGIQDFGSVCDSCILLKRLLAHMSAAREKGLLTIRGTLMKYHVILHTSYTREFGKTVKLKQY